MIIYMNNFKYKYFKYQKKFEYLSIHNQNQKIIKMSGGAAAAAPADIQKYLGDLTISKSKYNEIENKLKKLLKQDFDLTWFPGGKDGLIQYLLTRSDNPKSIRIDTNKLLEQLSMNLDQLENKLQQLFNFNQYTAFYLIGDPIRKRDLDLLVVVIEDVNIPLSESEYRRLLSEASQLDAELVRLGKLDLNFINMDLENNISQTFKGQSKFTQNILHFTYGLNRQIYPLVPLSKPFLPSDNPHLMHLELINYIDSMVKKILDSLKKLDPTNYKVLSKEKGKIYNSDSITRLNYVIDFIQNWMIRNKSNPLTTDQQEVLKSLTIKMIQFLLWREKLIDSDYFTKEGSLNSLITTRIVPGLKKSELMRILYIRTDDNVTSELFRPIFEIFVKEAPNYIWELPGQSTIWTSINIDTLDGDGLFDAIRTNRKYQPIISELYQSKYPVPRSGKILNLQQNFVGQLIPEKIKIVQKILSRLVVSDLNPRSREWVEMLADPRFKFGDNTGIRVYDTIPKWRIQLKHNLHLLQGMLAEQDIIDKFPFNTIFPDFELIEVGALIKPGPKEPYLGVCPDGLLVKTTQSQEIIPIEIKKIELGSNKAIQREIDLATRQLANTQEMLNYSTPNICSKICIILYDFHNFNVYYRII